MVQAPGLPMPSSDSLYSQFRYRSVNAMPRVCRRVSSTPSAARVPLLVKVMGAIGCRRA